MTPKALPMTQDQLRHGKAWVDALRSGKYEQCDGALYDGHGYCCLGVACALHGLESGGEFTLESAGAGKGYYYDSKNDLLPLSVQEWLGVDSECPCVSSCQGLPLTEPLELSEANDTEQWPFDEIADAIESDIYGGFKDLLPESE